MDLDSQLASFIEDWEPGKGTRCMIGFSEFLDLVVELETYDGCLSVELDSGALEELYKEKMESDARDREQEWREYYGSRGAV